MTELCLNERSLHELAWAPTAAARPASPGLGAAALAAVLDELDHGVLVVDAQGLVLQQNDAARRELAGAQLLRQGTEGRLEMAGSEGWLLGRAVANAALHGRRQMLPLRANGQRLMVAVLPLRQPAQARPCAVLLLGRRQICADLVVEMLGSLHELTPAEKLVLKALLLGQRVSDLARCRNVKVSTVRTQVAALRAKFGVGRIDDLTRLVAEMPPMASALRCAG